MPPFTDYCDLVVSMPREKQELIGRVALTQLSRTKRSLGKLTDEVTGGKSNLVITGGGDIFRLKVRLHLGCLDGISRWRPRLAQW